MFELTIHTDNAAFDDDTNDEVAKILRRVADNILNHRYYLGHSQTIFDSNGNDVGRFKLSLEN